MQPFLGPALSLLGVVLKSAQASPGRRDRVEQALLNTIQGLGSGIEAPWSAGTTYGAGAVVALGGTVFVSQKAANTGNAPSVATGVQVALGTQWWMPLQGIPEFAVGEFVGLAGAQVVTLPFDPMVMIGIDAAATKSIQVYMRTSTGTVGVSLSAVGVLTAVNNLTGFGASGTRSLVFSGSSTGNVAETYQYAIFG